MIFDVSNFLSTKKSSRVSPTFPEVGEDTSITRIFSIISMMMEGGRWGCILKKKPNDPLIPT
jgi:hypothetical protein